MESTAKPRFMKPGKMPVKDMSHLEGKVLFPEKLERARQILAPLIALRERGKATPPDSNT
jgi:hypothetical protein